MSESANSCQVCKQPTERRCSGCKLVYYCSAEHQKNDWQQHKSTCRCYQILQSPDLGQYVAATRDLSVGDSIFSEFPIVFGPKPHWTRDDYVPCVGCCKLIDEKTAVQCPECCWPCCNTSCDGLKSNTRHGLECRVLKIRRPTPETHFFQFFRFDTLIVLRVLLLQKINKSKFDMVLKLEDHLDKRGPDSEVFKDVDDKARFLLENYLNPLKDSNVLETFSQDLIHKIYGILDVNATDYDEDNISATILYPTVSLVEHNCTPNSSQMIFAGNNYQITFRAALPIEANNHVTSMYTHILWGTLQRRQHLKSLKYFECTCERCKDPTEFGTNFSALRCLGTEQQPCGGTQLPIRPLDAKVKWVCDKCKIKLPNGEIMKFVEHLGGEVDKVLETKPKVADLEELLEKLLKFLHPNHFYVYSVKHTLIQLYDAAECDGIELSSEFLKQKIGMCSDLRDITEKLDPGNARLGLYSAVIYFELFKAHSTLLKREDESSSLETAENFLELALKSLQFEKEGEKGRKLFQVISSYKK